MNIRLQQTFFVGSDWLYYRIYSGYKTSDIILTEIFKPINESLEKEGLIRKWFFIRYSDPNHHLRVRFLLNDNSCLGTIIQRIHENLNRLVENDLIWKIEIGTYQREIQRYGRSSMELSESLFFHQSKIIVSFLSLINGSEGEELRWMFSLRMIDDFLNRFNFKNDDKLRLLFKLKTGFGKEFGMTRSLKKQLDRKYRDKTIEIDNFMSLTKSSNPEFEPILDLFDYSNELSDTTIKEILTLDYSGNLEIDLEVLLESHIHMMLNRLFRSKNRLNEMVCYDFLFRVYKSRSARNRIR